MENPLSVVGFTAYPWNHALTWLRLQAPIEQAGMQFIQGNDYERIFPERIENADLVVIQRDFPRWADAYQEVIQLARSKGKPVIFELDDWLFELPQSHPDFSGHYYTQALFPMLKAMAEADAVTVATPALQANLLAYQPHCYVLPNYLDERIWRLDQPFREEAGGPLVIGYIGSNTHTPDLEMIAPVLVRLLNEYKDRLQIQIWGCEPPAQLAGQAGVAWQPLQIANYAEYVQFVSTLHCDIAIAPLNDHPFNRCKSAIKYLEYSAAGLPGVYSRLAPYETVVTHGVNGYLAGSLDEWRACLRQLIENRDLRSSFREAARASLQKKWLLSSHAREWEAAYRAVVERAAHPSAEPDPSNSAREMLIRYADRVQSWQQMLEEQAGIQAEQIAKLKQRLNEQKGLLEQQAKQMDELFTSRMGRLVRGFWKLRLRLFPAGSQVDRWLAHRRPSQVDPDEPVHK